MSIVETLASIEERSKRNQDFGVVRILDGTEERVLLADQTGSLEPSPKDACLAAQIRETIQSLSRSKRTIAELSAIGEKGSPLRIIIELIRPKKEIFIFGAGHVGQALALMSAIVGYEVTVIDDRKEFASRERLPDPRITLLVSDFGTAIEKLSVSAGTAIVIVTRGHQYDELCLRSVLSSPASYVGMIGSKRRVVSVFNKLAEAGSTDESLSRVHAPIGLKIGARSPQEIAVAILAEIISTNSASDAD